MNMAKSLHKIVHAHLADTHSLYEGVLKSIDEDLPAHGLLKAAIEACNEKMTECEKSEIAASLSKRTLMDDEQRRTAKVVPTNVSAVTPDDPNIRAVPRNGQPAI